MAEKEQVEEATLIEILLNWIIVAGIISAVMVITMMFRCF